MSLVCFLKGALMDFMSAKEASDKWGISKRRVQILCAEGRIQGAMKVGMMWVIPQLSEKPIDLRMKNITEIKREEHE